MHSSRLLSFRGALVASAIALAVTVSCASAQTNDVRVLHRFSVAPDDGVGPITPVQFDGAGNLYGTTRYGPYPNGPAGGGYGFGTIYKIAADGTETILHAFYDESGGYYPNEVTIDPVTGDLYGTTSLGGSGCTVGCGVLYKLSATGAFTVLHYFDGINDGSGPSGPLLLDKQGNLYGTAISGALHSQGDYGNGTVFKYGADGSFTVLHAFTGNDGLNPSGGVIGDNAGNLYGTTASNYTDGPDAPPSIYKLAPDGTLTTLHWFDDGTPTGKLLGDEAGNFYGTTNGAIFELAADGVYTTLHTFKRFVTGYTPNTDLLLIGGNLYGTTRDGGDPECFDYQGCGLVFKLAPNGAYSVLHAFAFGEHSVNPTSGLTLWRGRLFGVTRGRDCPVIMGPMQPACDAEVGSVYSVGVTK